MKRGLGAYGYQWWLRSYQVNGRNIDSYYAVGNAGQFIMIFPEFRMVSTIFHHGQHVYPAGSADRNRISLTEN